MSYAIAAYALYRGGDDAPEVCLFACMLGLVELLMWFAFFDMAVLS